MTDNIDYIYHNEFGPEYNQELDDLWQDYADFRNQGNIYELQRIEEAKKASRAYDVYMERRTEIMKLKHGEPVLQLQDVLMVTAGCWVIRDAVRYNREFPRSPLVVPTPDQECYLAHFSFWPGPETVVIYSDHGWLAHHVPYIDAQNMRRAWLASLKPRHYQP